MKNFEVEYIANGKKQKMFLKADNKVAARNLIKQKNGGVITKIGARIRFFMGSQWRDHVARLPDTTVWSGNAYDHDLRYALCSGL